MSSSALYLHAFISNDSGSNVAIFNLYLYVCTIIIVKSSGISALCFLFVFQVCANSCCEDHVLMWSNLEKGTKGETRGQAVRYPSLFKSDSTLNNLRGWILINHYSLMSWIDLKRGQQCRSLTVWDFFSPLVKAVLERVSWALRDFCSNTSRRVIKSEEAGKTKQMLGVWHGSHPVWDWCHMCISSRFYVGPYHLSSPLLYGSSKYSLCVLVWC